MNLSRAWMSSLGALFAVLVLLWSGAALAQGRPLGQIDTARGVERPTDATVARAAGGSIPARSLVRLYDGDRVVVTGVNTRLTLFIAGAETPVVVTRANSPFTVRGRSGGSSSAFATRMLASMDLLFNRPRMAIATATEARGPGDVATASPFLPAGPQRLPLGARPLIILWSGPTSAVQVSESGQTRDWVASDYASMLIDAPAAGDFEIRVPGGELGWTVTRVPAAESPRAPGAPTDTVLSDEERLANAIGLLSEGAPEWRLFALSEVADLARTDYGAARLLAAIRAGEIEPQALAVATE